MIVVECKNDELLMKRMGFSRREIDHAGNKGNVLNQVEKLEKAVGVIDEDPASAQPGNLGKYQTIKTKGKIKLLENSNDKGKFVVQISPYLENWLLSRAKQNNIRPEEYSLPENSNDLHSRTRLYKNPKFIAFLR